MRLRLLFCLARLEQSRDTGRAPTVSPPNCPKPPHQPAGSLFSTAIGFHVSCSVACLRFSSGEAIPDLKHFHRTQVQKK